MTSSNSLSGETDDIVALERMLHDERDALLKGDLEAIAALRPVKEDLLDRLQSREEGISRETYKSLSALAARNQVLLLHAARGIAAVRRRLQEVREAQTGGTGYDRTGRKIVGHQSSQLEKKA